MADPRNDGYKLVPFGKHPKHPVFPQLNERMTVPGTYYRYSPAEGLVSTLVTIMPNGTHVAHFSCRVCSALTVYGCTCRKGITVARSVEYIYDQTLAALAGEDWSVHHPNYKGSLSNAAKPASNGPVWVEAPPLPKQVTQPRRLTRHKEVVESEPLDLNKTNMDAAVMAESLAVEVTKRLDSKPRRSLKDRPRRSLRKG